MKQTCGCQNEVMIKYMYTTEQQESEGMRLYVCHFVYIRSKSVF